MRHEPRISVVTATCRRGYLPLVGMGLMCQEMDDYEWIIVDDHAEHPEQREAVAVLRAKLKRPITHLKPKKKTPYYAPAGARNAGVSVARGEVVYYCNEYIIPGPKSLKRHWDIYERHKGSVMNIGLISGPVIHPRPAIAATLSPDRIRVASWEPDWSGEGELVPEARDREAYIREHGMLIEDGLIRCDEPRWWWAGRNDSALREALNRLSAWHRRNPMKHWKGNGPENEMFDGGWGYADQQLAVELVRILHCRMVYDTEAVAIEIPHPRGMGKPRHRRTHEQQDLARAYETEREEILSKGRS